MQAMSQMPWAIPQASGEQSAAGTPQLHQTDEFALRTDARHYPMRPSNDPLALLCRNLTPPLLLSESASAELHDVEVSARVTDGFSGTSISSAEEEILSDDGPPVQPAMFKC